MQRRAEKEEDQLWTLAIKAFEAPILRYLPYVLLFFTYYIAISVATNSFNYNSIGGKANGVICALFAAAPALVLPWIQYITYYSTNHMMWFQRTMADPNYPMFVLWLFPIVLILSVSGIRFFSSSSRSGSAEPSGPGFSPKEKGMPSISSETKSVKR